jgi:two-component system response regulator YesN
MDTEKDLRILVVEDEIAVRRSLVGKLRSEGMSLLIEEAQNAEEAYELIQVSPPEIIFLDMRMPGMGGMKFLKVLAAEFPEIKVVIISGFSDFEFAQQALRCGAVDYLLKPILKETLHNTLGAVIEQVREYSAKRTREVRTSLIYNESVPLLRSSLLNKLLKGINLRADEIVKRLTHLGVVLDSPFHILAVIRVIDYNKAVSFYMKDSSLLFFALENVINESMGVSNGFVGFTNEVKENEFVCIFGLDDLEEIGQIVERLGIVIGNVAKFNKFNVAVSVSRSFSELNHMHQVYEEASILCGESNGTGVLLVGEHTTLFEVGFQGQLSPDDVYRLHAILERGEIKAILPFVDEAVHDERDKLAAAAIYRAIEEYMKRKYGESAKYFSCSKPSPEVEVKNQLIKTITDAAQYVARQGEAEPNEVIRKAMAYIDQYYYEDLTLEFISSKFFLNRTYFSELFSKEAGESFKKYVNRIRIEKAKRLLVSQKMKASAVAELVGFNDPVYFSIIFKKYTGMPPGEYKQSGTNF